MLNNYNNWCILCNFDIGFVTLNKKQLESSVKRLIKVHIMKNKKKK